MIVIDNVLISDDVIEKKFVCDLSRCKGACCEDGDAGAPLEESEKAIIDRVYETIRPYLTIAAQKEIEKKMDLCSRATERLIESREIAEDYKKSANKIDKKAYENIVKSSDSVIKKINGFFV